MDEQQASLDYLSNQVCIFGIVLLLCLQNDTVI